MERLREIILLNGWGLEVTAADVVLIIAALLGILLLNWVVYRKLLPWYYGKESTTSTNLNRIKRVVSLMLFSLFAVAVLRILEIDHEFFSYTIQQAPDGDSADVSFHGRISTVVTALVAFVTAGVLDLIISEYLVQRLHSSRTNDNSPTISGEEEERLIRRFGAVRPIMYILATILTVETTGLARYWFFRRPDDLRVIAKEGLSLLIDVERILLIILAFFVLRLLIVFFTTFVLQKIYNRSKVDVGSQFAINRLLTYFAYVFGVLLVIQLAGFNLVAIWTGAAALLVGIGIGLQQTFNDLICGIIILFERSVKVGDVVELTGHQVGTIRKIGTRTSILETRDDIMIYVPNSKLIGENVTNWSQTDRKARFHVQVGVAYGSDTSLVRDILLRVATDHGRVLDNPKPLVRLLNFGDSSLDFDLLFWSRDLVRIEDTKSDLRFAIDAAFRRSGVEIPFPQRDLWIRGGLHRVEDKSEEE